MILLATCALLARVCGTFTSHGRDACRVNVGAEFGLEYRRSSLARPLAQHLVPKANNRLPCGIHLRLRGPLQVLTPGNADGKYQ